MSRPTRGRQRVDLGRVRERLPQPVAEIVADYERHLALERGLSAHTVRAYLGDVVSMLGHLYGIDAATPPAEPSAGVIGEVTIATLRAWLAAQRAAGASRTTLARRSAAARTFTAWAHRRGHLDTDPGGRLVAPAAAPHPAGRAPRRSRPRS